MPTDLTYRFSGIDTTHTPGYVVDRPHGSGDHLFLRFRSPMEVVTRDGPVQAEPGDCLVYPPGQRQWYRGRGVPFRDDWLHLDGSLVERLLQRYSVPAGVRFRPAISEFFPLALREIHRIDLLRLPFWEEELAAVAERFVLHLGRAVATVPLAGLSAAQAEALGQVRSMVREDLRHRWTVGDMARAAGLGPSRFTGLYRLAFGTSPMDDLIQARVEHARWLLASTTMTLPMIAEEAGFSDQYYLIRQFRRRLGVTPGSFRRTSHR